MRLQVVSPHADVIPLQSAQDFERAFAIRYLAQLQFADLKTYQAIQKRCRNALLHQWITPRQKWLGNYYAMEMQGEVPLDLTIRWIDGTVGYGVWTNQPIAASAFVGEYTGLIRKRALWGRWNNLYCFDYTTGPWKSTSHVIDSQGCGNHTRFINHSFDPNLKLVSVYYKGMMRVILYALANIPANTQLCYDYGQEYWAKRGKPLKL
jgi:uncharacterized protein